VKSRLLALVILPFIWVVASAGVPLTDPPPVSVPAGIKPEQVVRAIKAAFAEKGWIISKEEPGRLEATLNIRSHVARVSAQYDARSVQLSYIDSVNLDYEEKNGKREIHRNYPKWVNNVIVGIQRNLLMMPPSS
jgi:hypothetical protein